MEFFINAFNILLYQPLFNALIFLYQIIPGQDFGIAIIILTILIKVIFYPLTTKAIKSQRILAELQPKIQEVQQKFKQDKEKQAKEMMAFYQKEKINPFSGCFPMLIQLPILIALFQVFIRGFGPEQMEWLYGFVPHPGVINFYFLGIVNLIESNIIIALLAGIAQFFQSKMMFPKTKKIKQGEGQMAQFSAIIQKQMIYFMPFFTVFILLGLPSAMGLYWLVTALFSIGQQRLILKHQKPSLREAETKVKKRAYPL